MRKFVFKNNNGFTMIEMLLSLSFLLIILALIPLLIKSIYVFKENAFNHSDYEMIMFRKDLADESKDAKIDINDFHRKIKFTRGNSSVEYTLMNSKIYKSINGKGNITLLNNVENFKLRRINENTILINIDIRTGGKIIHEEIYI